MSAQLAWCPRCGTQVRADLACPRCGSLPVQAAPDRDTALFEARRPAAAVATQSAWAWATQAPPVVQAQTAPPHHAPPVSEPPAATSSLTTRTPPFGTTGHVSPVPRTQEPWTIRHEMPTPRNEAHHDLVPRPDRPVRARTRLDRLALVAFLAGLAGLGPIAVWLGAWGRSHVRHHPNRAGYGLATAGLWLGVVASVLYVWIALRLIFPYA
ncbi:MAG: hypothetical protein IT198_14835 [Acidimicrobiia bacterium]|nr:hypothetical protein [Acidimicrobiia bacterium]